MNELKYERIGLEKDNKSTFCPEKKYKKIIRVIIRLLFVLLGGFMASINAFFGTGLVKGEPKCIEDKFFQFTENLNKLINDEKFFAKFALITSSTLLDIHIITSTIIWFNKSKNWRIVISIIIMLLIKLLNNLLMSFKNPSGMFYEYPGFPSLSVSYTSTETFFFSGYLAISFIFVIYSYKIKNFYLFIYGLVVMLLYSITAIILRFNYIIDLGSALIVAHYSYMMAKYPSRFLDNKIPLVEIEQIDDQRIQLKNEFEIIHVSDRSQ